MNMIYEDNRFFLSFRFDIQRSESHTELTSSVFFLEAVGGALFIFIFSLFSGI